MDTNSNKEEKSDLSVFKLSADPVQQIKELHIIIIIIYNNNNINQ